MTTRDHLLRTMAAVAPGTRIVVSACGDGGTAVDLSKLGLDVWACDADVEHVETLRVSGALPGPPQRVAAASPSALGYPDGFAAWGALDLERVRATDGDPAQAFAELSRVVALGGWLWLCHESLEDLLGVELPVGVVPAEAPHAWADGATVIVRRVDDSVVA